MKKGFSNEVYSSWKTKQLEKYRDLEPLVKNVLNESEKVLDIGIGKAWFWNFLENKGYHFDKVIGVDVSRKATEPEKDGIKYIYTDNLVLENDFDLVVAFDSVHLINYKEDLVNFVRKGGHLLQSTPLKFKDEVITFKEMDVVRKGRIGNEEVDLFTLQRKE